MRLFVWYKRIAAYSNSLQKNYSDQIIRLENQIKFYFCFLIFSQIVGLIRQRIRIEIEKTINQRVVAIRNLSDVLKLYASI
jgi:hypothetical protein